jgi:hypothetical protein
MAAAAISAIFSICFSVDRILSAPLTEVTFLVKSREEAADSPRAGK